MVLIRGNMNNEENLFIKNGTEALEINFVCVSKLDGMKNSVNVIQ